MGAGGVLGGTASLMAGGSFWRGAMIGGILSGIGGAVNGYITADKTGLNPWTGNKTPSLQTSSNVTLRLSEPEIKVTLDTERMRTQLKAMPDMDQLPNQQPLTRVDYGDGNAKWIVKQQDISLSPRQAPLPHESPRVVAKQIK